MLADDLDAELKALEDAAPLTPEPHEQPDVRVDDVRQDAVEDGQAAEWKPPTREHFENMEKARRADREALREQRRQSQIYEQNFQRMQERFDEMQRQQALRQFQAPPPDPYEQPEQAREWQRQQQAFQQQLFQAEQQRHHQERQAQAQERHFQQVSTAVEDYESEFKAAHPDYDDATDHMLGIQQKILEGMGYSPQVAAQQVAVWSVNVAQQALQSGRNPAEVAYDFAKQMGYTPKGQLSAAQVSASDKLAAIAAGQGASKTLSGGGGAGAGRPSLKSIAGLEGAAFDSAMDKWLSDQIKGR